MTKFKFRTDFSHGNEVAYSCDQKLFFSSLTQLRRQPSVSIRKKYPLEPRVSESETSHSNSLRSSSFCWEEIRRALDRLSVPVATIERGAAEHLTDGGKKRTLKSACH